MDISILSNINIDLLTSRLSKKHNVYKPAGYGIWVQEITDPCSELYAFRPKAVFIILDAEELIHGMRKLDEVRTELTAYITFLEQAAGSHPDITYFISSVDLPQCRLQSIEGIREEPFIESFWYKKLSELTLEYKNLYVFDLKALAEITGQEMFYSKKMWYLGGMKFTPKAERLIEKSVLRYINALEGKRKKCIVVDLDNTLWGGIVGEAGKNGIELSESKEGARYKDFQKRLKEIRELGIILAIASKNNYEDAIEVIRTHRDMVLREDDFVSIKINWNPKSQSLREIASELNIGLDSIIFIDDSPIERESIIREIPEITVPEFPSDTSELNSFITEIYFEYLLSLKTTDEDKEKTSLYRQNIKRECFMKHSASSEAFLQSLETKIRICQAGSEDIPRVSQLTQKTNQFNLTTRRYTEADIEAFITSGNSDIYIASVEDKFGYNGKVGVVIIKKTDSKTAEIDTFLMSCRIMGRYIEDQLIGFVEDRLAEEGFGIIRACYLPTGKNKPAEGLFDRLGYFLEQSSNAGEKHYSVSLPVRNKTGRKAFGEVLLK